MPPGRSPDPMALIDAIWPSRKIARNDETSPTSMSPSVIVRSPNGGTSSVNVNPVMLTLLSPTGAARDGSIVNVPRTLSDDVRKIV